MKRFETGDLHEAAAYCAAGFTIQAITRVDSYNCTFLFDSTPEFEKAHKDYWADDLKVSALKYSMTIDNTARRVKSIPSVK